jgi:hypothetical protein
MAFGRYSAIAAGVATVMTMGALVTGVARAAPSSFELLIDGFRSPAAPPEKFFASFRNEGPFTASAVFCSSGYAIDLEWLGPLGAVHGLRQFSCSDGMGSVTARQRVLRTDLTTYLEGDWRIVDGTGRYATLRGKGTFATALGGDPIDPTTRTFRETWRGLVDFDAVPPTVAISRAKAERLRRPTGSYSIGIAFTARDAGEGSAVSYRITVGSGAAVLVARSGETTSGTASATFRVRPKKNVKSLRLVIVASDPLGNERTVTRSVKLPH